LTCGNDETIMARLGRAVTKLIEVVVSG